jgi:hypothetical protein
VITVKVEIAPSVSIRFDVESLGIARLRLYDDLFPWSNYCHVIDGNTEYMGSVGTMIRKLSELMCNHGGGPVPLLQEVTK